MASRLKLHEELIRILDSENRVYFQPPENIKISYPCIIYSVDGYYTNHADNLIYRNKTRYSITLIDRDPDTPLVLSLLKLPLCRFDRAYDADNLHHYTFSIYY